jgi:hypothetical protein
MYILASWREWHIGEDVVLVGFGSQRAGVIAARE